MCACTQAGGRAGGRLCACVGGRVLAGVRAYVRACPCVRACGFARVRACGFACVCIDAESQRTAESRQQCRLHRQTTLGSQATVQALVRKYAFAIVFENSIVHDYVSEKVYGALQAALLLGTVVCRLPHVACIASPWRAL